MIAGRKPEIRKNRGTLNTLEGGAVKKRSKTKKDCKEAHEDKPEHALPSRAAVLTKELTIDRPPLMLGKDRKHCLEVSGYAGDDAKTWRFARIPNSAESFYPRTYSQGSPKPYSALIHKVGKSWFLYRQYVRSDKLTGYDIFEEKMYFYQKYAGDYIGGTSLQNSIDFMSIAPILAADYTNRRRRSIFGKSRLPLLNARCQMMLPAHRKAFAREVKSGLTVWPWMIAENSAAVRKSMEQRVLSLEYMAKNDKRVKENVEKFKKRNLYWWKGRLSMSERQFLGNDIEAVRSLLTDDSVDGFLRQSPQSLTNELHHLSPSYAHMYYFCRVVKRTNVSIYKASQTCYKVINGRRYPLRIRPTTYQYGPPAVNVFKQEKDDSAKLSLCVPPTRAPSIESMSGFSSNSRASTATVSPGDWLYNWKTQSFHKDLEHRLLDRDLQNPVEERRKAQLEKSQRISNEVDYRFKVLGGTSVMASYQYAVTNPQLAELIHNERAPFVRNQKAMKYANARVAELKSRMKNSTGANQAILEMAVSRARRALPISAEDDFFGLDVSPSWITIMDKGFVQDSDMNHIIPLVNSHHSWVQESPFSEAATIPRADKQLIETNEHTIPLASSLWTVVYCFIIISTSIIIGILASAI